MKKPTIHDLQIWIPAKMEELTKEASKLPELIEGSAQAQRDYDKSLALTIVKLKGEGTPTTMVEKVARGYCADELYVKIVAEGKLKACYSNIERIKAQLNACQSLNKHLDVV